MKQERYITKEADKLASDVYEAVKGTWVSFGVEAIGSYFCALNCWTSKEEPIEGIKAALHANDFVYQILFDAKGESCVFTIRRGGGE